VSRKWLDEVVSAEETSIQVQAVFCDALEAEGLMDQVAARLDGTLDLARDDPARPILLAMSDDGPQMTPGVHPGVHGVVRDPPAPRPTRHPNRSGLDRVAVRPRQGQVSPPHPLAIRDPAVMRAELAVVEHYDTVRLHAGIGYVTPTDEHTGRGGQIQGPPGRPGASPAVSDRLPSRPAPQPAAGPTPARPDRGARRCWLIDPGSLSPGQIQVTPYRRRALYWCFVPAAAL
jgi:hypothetical protein